MAIAALDLGKRRIGIALAERDSITALPIATIERRSNKRDIAQISECLAGFNVSHFVVGLPLNMDGSSGPAARAAENFAQSLQESTGLRVDLHDERLTSFEAESRLQGSTGRRGRKKGATDAVAACIILEGWLEGHRRAP